MWNLSGLGCEGHVGIRHPARDAGVIFERLGELPIFERVRVHALSIRFALSTQPRHRVPIDFIGAQACQADRVPRLAPFVRPVTVGGEFEDDNGLITGTIRQPRTDQGIFGRRGGRRRASTVELGMR
jgi:hypothetical protein